MQAAPVELRERLAGSSVGVKAISAPSGEALSVFGRLHLTGTYRGETATVTALPVAQPVHLIPELQAALKCESSSSPGATWPTPRAGGAEVYTEQVEAVGGAGHQITLFAAAVADRPIAEKVDGYTVVRWKTATPCTGGPHMVVGKTSWAVSGFDLVIDMINIAGFEAHLINDVPTVAFIHQTT